MYEKQSKRLWFQQLKNLTVECVPNSLQFVMDGRFECCRCLHDATILLVAVELEKRVDKVVGMEVF